MSKNSIDIGLAITAFFIIWLFYYGLVLVPARLEELHELCIKNGGAVSDFNGRSKEYSCWREDGTRVFFKEILPRTELSR